MHKLRICEDAICLYNSEITSIKVTRKLLDQVRKSHIEYSAQIVQQKYDLMQPQKKHKFEEAHAAENQIKMVINY